MNARAPSLQERILGLLGEHGSVAAKDVPRYLRQYDDIDLDTALTALMRGGKVSLASAHYSLTDFGRRDPTPTTPRCAIAIAQSALDKATVETRAAPPAPPTASEEAAASTVPTKTCRKCNTPKPRDTGFYKNPNYADGYETTCKTCRDKQRAARRNDEEPETQQPDSSGELTEQRCKGKCQQVKPIDQFHKNPAFKSGRDSTCKACRFDRQQEVRGVRAHTETTTQSGPEPGLEAPAPDVPPGGSTGDVAPRDPATAPSGRQASPAAATGHGDEKAEPQSETAPEKGDRQSSAVPLGKGTPVQSDSARHRALERKAVLTAQTAAIAQELAEIEQFLRLYDRFVGAVEE